MAKLLDTEYKLTTDCVDNWEQHAKEFDAIPTDRIFSHPYADGRAYYYIVTEKPLVLQHIPYGDAWQLPYAHIRGLRLSDIQAKRKWDKGMAELFK